MVGLKKLKSTDDSDLSKFDNIPVIKILRKYREITKQISTYGMTWVTEWTTHPCNEEGLVHPGDHRLHSIFNQYDADTGRSASEKPNGQNIPLEKELRSCFIADPLNEDIRISVCCDYDTYWSGLNSTEECYYCVKCNKACETKPEEYDIITADMSGAELRIIADGANAKSWIDAFNRGEDVHSVGTEILFPKEWPELKEEGCSYYKTASERKEYDVLGQHYIIEKGDPLRQKCNCKGHKEKRDGNKSTNFLVAYDLDTSVHNTLAARTGMSPIKAKELIDLHKSKFPDIWSWLIQLGKQAREKFESRDIFGRRRLFTKPNWDLAKVYAKDKYKDFLKVSDEEEKKRLTNFEILNGRKATKEEKSILLYNEPSIKQISSSFAGMFESIERQGKNQPIQGSNATIAKLSMGCGYDEKQNLPFLWHTLLQYKAKLLKFVHDELVIQSPKRYSKQVAKLIGDAFKRAAGERMTRVIMEFDYNIASHWKK